MYSAVAPAGHILSKGVGEGLISGFAAHSSYIVPSSQHRWDAPRVRLRHPTVLPTAERSEVPPRLRFRTLRSMFPLRPDRRPTAAERRSTVLRRLRLGGRDCGFLRRGYGCDRPRHCPRARGQSRVPRLPPPPPSPLGVTLTALGLALLCSRALTQWPREWHARPAPPPLSLHFGTDFLSETQHT